MHLCCIVLHSLPSRLALLSRGRQTSLILRGQSPGLLPAEPLLLTEYGRDVATGFLELCICCPPDQAGHCEACVYVRLDSCGLTSQVP